MEDGDCLIAELGSDGVVPDAWDPDVDEPEGVPGIGADPVDDDGSVDEWLPVVGD